VDFLIFRHIFREDPFVPYDTEIFNNLRLAVFVYLQLTVKKEKDPWEALGHVYKVLARLENFYFGFSDKFLPLSMGQNLHLRNIDESIVNEQVSHGSLIISHLDPVLFAYLLFELP
jgi:hypothetical protein